MAKDKIILNRSVEIQISKCIVKKNTVSVQEVLNHEIDKKKMDWENIKRFKKSIKEK